MFMRNRHSVAAVMRVFATLLLVILVTIGDAAKAQETRDPFLEGLERAIERAKDSIDGSALNRRDVELLRERLLRLRADALAFEQRAALPFAEAKVRLERLSPAPAEGVEEPAELAARRAAFAGDVANAQVPVLDAQDVVAQIDTILRDMDRQAWARLTTELMTRGPSPLLPSTWRTAERALGTSLRSTGAAIDNVIDDPERRTEISRQLPLVLVLLVLGIAATVALGRWITGWVERALRRARSPQTVAWLVVVRNGSKLILPVAAAAMVFIALKSQGLTGSTVRFEIFDLPAFVSTIIGAGWLANSLFSTRLASYRLVPLGDDDAVRGSRLVWGLGVILALHLGLEAARRQWSLSPETQAALAFPILVLGGLALSRVAALMSVMRRTADSKSLDTVPDVRPGPISLGLLDVLRRVLLVVAVVAPALAAIGYLAAARQMMFPMILTVALIGAGVVVYDLVQKTSFSLLSNSSQAKEGLGPVIIVVVIGLLATPLLALIWGARTSDLSVAWALLRDGVSLGGIRISLSDILTFVIVFGLVYGLTRTVQSLLRGSVLPRTRMDAGGRNAVLAGIGYLGFFIATLAAISSTGIDLSNIAIVAGALSVGIGFGLQNVVSNFVSGIILLVERPIKEGDWIEVGAYSGYVSGISVRSTVIETFDHASVIVPNSDLVAGTVLNWTHSGISGRLRVPISVAYDSDPKQVEAILLEVAQAHPTVMETPPPKILFIGFGADALDFEIRCWLSDVNFTLSARSDMNHEILSRFRAAKIDIPFPQRDVHVRGLDTLSDALAGTPRGAHSA